MRAAWLSGINVDLVKTFNYCLGPAGRCGLMITGRLLRPVTIGVGLELRVITAAIIGASLSGGEGSVLGASWARRGVPGERAEFAGVDVIGRTLSRGALILAVVRTCSRKAQDALQ
jgi:ribose/xylose/arabinose/galactoside ABC-type transport system permease subunit